MMATFGLAFSLIVLWFVISPEKLGEHFGLLAVGIIKQIKKYKKEDEVS